MQQTRFRRVHTSNVEATQLAKSVGVRGQQSDLPLPPLPQGGSAMGQFQPPARETEGASRRVLERGGREKGTAGLAAAVWTSKKRGALIPTN